MRLFAVLCTALLCTALFGYAMCCVAQCCPLLCRAVLPRVVLSLHTSTVLCQSSQSSRQPSTATAPGDPALHTLHSALCTSHKSQSALEAAATTTAAAPPAAAAGRIRGAKKNKAALLLVLGKMKFKSVAKFLLLIKWDADTVDRAEGRVAKAAKSANMAMAVLWSRRFSSHKFNQHQI